MTPSKENYIKAVYELGGSEIFVPNKKLTEILNISGASVTEMNNRLEKENLLKYIPYKGVQLTEIGNQYAIELIRKHRIWEVFLAEVLHYNWADVHDEADRLEHASSDLLIEKLYDFLGQPTHDPHGGIIPVKGDQHIHSEFVPLNKIKKNSTFIIREFDDNRDVLTYAENLNLHLNETYTIIRHEQLDQSVVIHDMDGQTIHLPPSLTASIYVEQI